MNRLQKKCFIVATGMHLLLLVILLVGPAFLSSSSKLDDSKVIDFVLIPDNLNDRNFTGGGGPPKSAPLTARAEQQPPAQPVQRQVEQPKSQPKTVKSEPKPSVVKSAPDAVDTSKPTRSKPNISTEVVTRNSSGSTKPNTTTQQNNSDTTRRTAELNKIVSGLRSGLSSTTEIETPGGLGGSGEIYASYSLVVKSIYQNAWIAPDSTANDEATAKVSVTIASDGRVISSRITTPSGDKQTDASIQRTLDRVNFIAPFPKESKESQRTFIINFNLKAKRLSA